MDFEEEEIERMLPTAQHEFGHFTVARVVGFPTGDVTIAAKTALAGPGGTAAIQILQPLRSPQDVVAYCEKRIRVLMAGVLAEALEDGAIDNSRAILYAETTGSNDHAKVRELLQLIRGILHPDTTDEPTANSELKSLSDRLWNETATIVTNHASFIEALALELVEKPVKAYQSPTFTEAELSSHPLVLSTFP